MFQKNLEEEVKKDQKEKKANHEVLKSLKVERERLVEEQKRYKFVKRYSIKHFDIMKPVL